MNLIILSDRDRVGNQTYRLTFHRAEHIRSVLRAVEGDLVQVGVLNGPAGVARIERITDYDILLSCEELHAVPAPVPTVDLICALPRPQTLKKILFTSAMMGVRRLHLIRANRVEKSYFHSPLLEHDHYLPHLIEGLSQGRLTRLPEIAIHDRFKLFYEEILPNLEHREATPSVRLLPDLDSALTLRAFYRGDAPRLIIAIGPEGGWVPFEVEVMTSLGFKRFRLGRFTLRVEHAVTAALSQIELLRMS